MIDIPYDLGISSTFNIEYLVLFHGKSAPIDPFVASTDSMTQLPLIVPPLPPLPAPQKEIEVVLNDQTLSTRWSGY